MPGSIEVKLDNDQYTVSSIRLKKGEVLGPYKSNREGIVFFVVDGSVTVQMERAVFTTQKGNCLAINGTQIYTLKSTADEAVESALVSFTAKKGRSSTAP